MCSGCFGQNPLTGFDLRERDSKTSHRFVANAHLIAPKRVDDLLGMLRRARLGLQSSTNRTQWQSVDFRELTASRRTSRFPSPPRAKQHKLLSDPHQVIEY